MCYIWGANLSSHVLVNIIFHKEKHQKHKIYIRSRWRMEGDINAKGINLKFMHVFRCAPQRHAMSIKMVISILGHAWAPICSGCLK